MEKVYHTQKMLKKYFRKKDKLCSFVKNILQRGENNMIEAHTEVTGEIITRDFETVQHRLGLEARVF